MGAMTGTVALVAGASRGVGRGVAVELGEAGATVWVTGRSRDGGPTTDGMPETLDGTARLVDEAGGRALPVTCDHTDDEAVAELARRIREESGALHLFVNCVWGGYEDYDHAMFQRPLEDQPLWRWDRMFATGVRANYVTARAMAPLMEASGGGLMIGISAGDQGKFLHDVQYDVAKAAVDRLGFALARKLGPRGIVALTLHPGFTRTERVLAEAPPEALAGSHSARFVGRGVVALYTDPRRGQRAGGVFKLGDLGREYGFTDVDGSRPDPFVIPEQEEWYGAS